MMNLKGIMMNGKALYIVPIVLAGLVVSLLAYQHSLSTRPVEIPAGTRLSVRLNQTFDTARNRSGDTFSAMLDAPVMENGKVLVPEGTPFRGHITAAKPSGRLKGRGYMAVSLDSFELNGQTYKLATNSQSRVTGSHKKRN